LPVAECAELARELGAEISGPALRSLVELTGGNPLAVLENLAGATGGTGRFEPGRLALGAALERAWGRVFDELPEDTRHALFVVATDAVSGGRHVDAALGALRLSLASLAPAERRGLICAADGQIQLRHPLMRPVVVRRTPLWARAAACRALAGAAGGHLRAWYLAAAATGPDDAAAEALAAAAAGARQRHGYGASARTWRRAAELTADRGLRARRLLRAAADGYLAGDWEAALSWCQEALGQCHVPVLAAEAELIRGRARTWACFATAHAAHARQPMPFEQARTLLCQGEALRRSRRPAASRAPLRHALTIFTSLDARPWAARAMTELDATGARAGTPNTATASALNSLSPQELQVARAVGRGLNNVETAAALFVSRKTVEAHLTRAYRKLGIRSRTELTRLLVTWDQTPVPA
jgi:DNA-binding CsgD family transcriptional regulator